ncbi:glycosyltransferase family 2 protein [Actinomyces sp. MRS3W]|uniref:glycosyltransferase family 2 protein n=1 Tax=Actinomyces sp. MRS3W TaxID=2800796 RepID=UPI0028FCFEAE|nr:glycosyltransferase family 2 protein [Actinomyces sp. MRS3W]MDU0349476.1 glycosyltransferase family 2 protein [Actinomyces sp. MRS3W]
MNTLPPTDAGRLRLGPATIARTDLGQPDLPAGARVDVVVACHTPTRPIGRAVASLLDGNPEAAVTVVCHNRSAEEIAAEIRPAHRDLVRYLEHTDPRPSASGPFNAGMRAARTPWVSIMGSDDQLAPGAVASWLALAEATGAEFVVPRLALGRPTAIVPTPAPRPTRLLATYVRSRGFGGRASQSRLVRRFASTDLVADRLAYRSAPLGLLSVEMLRRTGAHLVEGATVGGDVAMVTRLFACVPTAYDAAGPVYLIGEDASDRVTYVVRPITEQLGFLPGLLTADWFTALGAARRRAVVVKMVRIHVFGAVYYRDREDIWTPTERAALAGLCRRLHHAAPGFDRVLSRADRDLLDACLDPAVPASVLMARAQARRRHGRPETLFTRDPAWLLDREAPLRFMAASLLTKLLPSAPVPVLAGSRPTGEEN